MILRPGTFLPDSHLCLPDSHLLTVQCSAIPASTVFINSDFPLLKKWPVFFFFFICFLSPSSYPHSLSWIFLLSTVGEELSLQLRNKSVQKPRPSDLYPTVCPMSCYPGHQSLSLFFLTEYKLLLSHAQCSALAQTWKNHVHQQKSFLCSQKWIWQ